MIPQNLSKLPSLASLLAVLLLAGTALSLTACNTTRGVGQDVEAAGEGIHNAAEEVEEEFDD